MPEKVFELIICAGLFSFSVGPSFASPFVLKQNVGTFNLRIAAEHTQQKMFSWCMSSGCTAVETYYQHLGELVYL
jgi:hypothetical protein